MHRFVLMYHALKDGVHAIKSSLRVQIWVIFFINLLEIIVNVSCLQLFHLIFNRKRIATRVVMRAFGLFLDPERRMWLTFLVSIQLTSYTWGNSPRSLPAASFHFTFAKYPFCVLLWLIYKYFWVFFFFFCHLEILFAYF